MAVQQGCESSASEMRLNLLGAKIRSTYVMVSGGQD